MDLNLNSLMIIIYIFMVCLGICYFVARIIHSGPIKITEHGTIDYIINIIVIVVAAIILTAIIVLNYNNLIDIKSIFNT
jgi:uncharacterized membrane protein YedE/YeeE